MVLRLEGRLPSHSTIIVVTAILVLAILALIDTAGYASVSDDDGESKQRSKESRRYPEKMKSRKGYEYILDLPGILLSLPLKLALKGIGNSIGYIDETKLVARINDYLTSDDGLRALRPTYSSRTGAGLKFYQKNTVGEGSRIELLATAGLRSRQRYQFALKRVPLFGKLIFSDLSIGYQLQPDELFYGIGPDSREEDKSNFALEQAYLHFAMGASPGGGFEVELTADLEHSNVLAGKDERSISTVSLFKPEGLPGLESEVRMAGFELALHYLPRDYIGNASSGPTATIGGGYNGQIGDETYGFWRFRAEIALYLHLFHGRMLVMRTAGQMIDPMDGRSVPFYLQSEIGRRETVRGFSRGRFRDLDMVIASIEYHYPIWIHRDDRLNAFLFSDAGQVARDFKNDLDRDDLSFGLGGGIVFRSTEEELFRFTIAKSEERWRIYFVYNQ